MIRSALNIAVKKSHCYYELRWVSAHGNTVAPSERSTLRNMLSFVRRHTGHSGCSSAYKSLPRKCRTERFHRRMTKWISHNNIKKNSHSSRLISAVLLWDLPITFWALAKGGEPSRLPLPMCLKPRFQLRHSNNTNRTSIDNRNGSVLPRHEHCWERMPTLIVSVIMIRCVPRRWKIGCRRLKWPDKDIETQEPQ